MRRLLLLLLFVLPLACRPPRTADGPFVVETWDGTEHAGNLSWGEDDVRVNGCRLDRQDVQLIRRRASRAGATVAEVEGFEPLGEDELRRYRERAEAAAEKHPGVNSVLCLDYGQDTLTPDGKHVWRYHALVLVLKEEGREAADMELGFTKGRSRRRVLFARSVSPVGKSLWLDPATLKISTPAQGQRHLDTRRRVLSGRIPGVQVGSLVEYAHEYVLYNPDVPDYFFPGYYFQGEKPYLDSIIDVRVPTGRPLYWTTKHVPQGAREPKRSTRGKYDVYRWAMHDQPPLVPEPSMPDKTDVVPQVHGSLFQDWDELHQRTGGYQTERIEVTPDIQKLAQQIVGDATTADAKLARIYHWVQRKINYMSIKASRASGWAGHHATETLGNGYGDCTDKAIVFASLAKAAGIRSYPVILKTNTEGQAVTDIPMPDANHCINVAYPNGKRRFLDATAENYRYPYFRADDHGVKAVIHIPGEITDIPVPPPDHNLRESRQTLTLQPDGNAVCVERNAYTGPYEARVRGFWRSVPPTLHPRMMQQYLQRRSPGALCTDFELSDLDDLSQQLTMSIDYKVPGLATKTRDLYIVSPPGFDRQFPEAALQERVYAIEHHTSAGYETTIEVTPPEGYELVAAPEPLTIQGKHLRFEGRVERAKDGKSLILRKSFKRPTRVVPAADYPTYREHAARIAAWTRLRLVFRKTQ